MPKVPAEDLFVNMAINMNMETHKYRGYIPFTMPVVSIEVALYTLDAIAYIIILERRKQHG